MDTIVAAECCYGAQLYDPVLATSHGLCLHYLDQGAIAFWGSSNIAWGPAHGNGQADLIAQYFLQEVLRGASLGRAALAARQRFARQASPALLPVDLKTLAQFVLLGDPSVHPIALPATASTRERLAETALDDAAPSADRKQRRWLMEARAEQLENSVRTVSKAGEAATGRLDTKLTTYAENLGLEMTAHRVYRIEESPTLTEKLGSVAAKARSHAAMAEPLVHALVGRRAEQKKVLNRIPSYMIAYVFQYGDRLVKGPICFRR